jgi:hypothetical protein
MADFPAELVLLLEERAIERVINRWQIAMDKNDAAELERCVAGQFGGVYKPHTQGEMLPRKEAVEAIMGRVTKVGNFHSTHGKIINIDGDKAKVHCHMISGHWSKDKVDWAILFGLYEFDLVKEGADWKITLITIEPGFEAGTGMAKVMTHVNRPT